MKKNLLLPILIGLFVGLFLLKTYKEHSGIPQSQLQTILTDQGYQGVEITNSNFGFCPKILEIAVRFKAALNDKEVEGIACFSVLGNLAPRIQFKN